MPEFIPRTPSPPCAELAERGMLVQKVRGVMRNWSRPAAKPGWCQVCQHQIPVVWRIYELGGKKREWAVGHDKAERYAATGLNGRTVKTADGEIEVMIFPSTLCDAADAVVKEADKPTPEEAQATQAAVQAADLDKTRPKRATDPKPPGRSLPGWWNQP